MRSWLQSLVLRLRIGHLAAVLVGAAGLACAAPSVAAVSLPDSILAQVGSRRRISVNDFRRGWSQVSPPARPDSLTPQSAREFLQLLIGKEALGEAALRQTWVWAREESARYTSTRDHLLLEAALEQPLEDARAELARAGLPADAAAAGIAARDSAFLRMGASFDPEVIQRLTRAFAALPKPSPDSGLFAQIRVLAQSPAVEARDSLAAVVHTREGDYRVGELMEWWRKLSPFSRPRVETAEQMRDVVKNGVFERKLRRTAATLGLEKRPDIVAELARLREYFAVTHLVTREVYDSLDADSITLRRFYDRNPAAYMVPARVRALHLVLPGRAEAAAMALRLRDRATADSLAAISSRKRLGYLEDISAASDSTLFAAGMRAGTGSVLGPDSLADGWSVARIEAILPAQSRSFEEARKLVEHEWYGVEGERRMADLIDRLRRSTRVIVNSRALARLARP